MATRKANGFTAGSQNDLAHQMIQWTTTDVEQFLINNNIHGCSSILEGNKIDGQAFLGLNSRHLLSWGIPRLKQAQIICLLNDVGSEDYRSDIVIKSQISSRLQHLVSHKLQESQADPPSASFYWNEGSKKLSNTNNLTGVPMKKNCVELGKCSNELTQQKQPPPIPPKPFKSSQRLNPTFDINYQRQQSRVVPQQEDPQAENGDYEVPICDPNMDNSPFEFKSGDKAIDDFYALDDEENYVIPDEQPPGIPQVMYESDEFTSDEEDDELEDIFTLAVESKNRARKKGFFAGLFSPIQSKPKQIVMDEKTNEVGDRNNTPPILPQRAFGSKCPSEGNLDQSGLERSAPPMPPLLTLPTRKKSTLSSTSSSNLGELSPVIAPGPVQRRQTPPTPQSQPSAQQGSNFLLGSQTWSTGRLDKSKESSRNPSPCTSVASGSNSSTYSDASSYPWFFNVDRRQAEALLNQAENGTFLIRPSKNGGDNAHFSLSLQFNKKVFHIVIRKRPDGKLALGSEKLEEMTFTSLNELVQHHWVEPMILHSNNQLAGSTPLIYWPEISN